MLEKYIYVLAVTISAAIPVIYFLRNREKEKKAKRDLSRAVYSGLIEPVSLHPRIDPNRCIGTGACIKACPEGDILGLINGFVELVSPSRCIGHGACEAACPVDAIELVFGSEKRGIEIPYVKENFETNVAGISIAGELGGMGLIRNAITQGRQAVEFIARNRSKRDPAAYDVAIIGAGPAGLAATLQAHQEKMSYITLDQDDIGGTILSYPRQKLVMTQPMEIPYYGRYKDRQIQKEELLELWDDVIAKSGAQINTNEKVESINRSNGHYQITTSKGEYVAQRIVLAIGRRGSPRKLGVPGEKSAKVAYKLLEPDQYAGQSLIVVGGGDSAVEAALALSALQNTDVTLSYRGEAFNRIKEKNRELLHLAEEQGTVQVLLKSNVKEIRPETVLLDHDGVQRTINNRQVFVFVGGELPNALLQKLGIDVQRKFGTR